MHYYSFNIGDYAKHTRHLSNLEDLAYRRLIDLYYTHETPFNNDLKQISRLIGMRDNIAEIELILSDFFTLEDDLWVSKRADKEIANYHRKADSARANGKKGGRPAKPNKTQPVNLANPATTGSKANQEPLTNNQQPSTKSAKANKDVLDVFDYWKQVMKKNSSAILNDKRTKAIEGRFKEGYTVDQIKMAITGCSMTPHNMGQNDNNKKYDDIELICRDGVKVETFANNCQEILPLKQKQQMSSFPEMEE